MFAPEFIVSDGTLVTSDSGILRWPRLGPSVCDYFLTDRMVIIHYMKKRKFASTGTPSGPAYDVFLHTTGRWRC